MSNEKYDDSDHRGHLDVLGSIPIEYRNAILKQCDKLVVRQGQILWNQGDPAEYVGFLVEGKLMSTYLSPNGKTGVTGFFWFAGDILGATDLGGSKQRLMTVRCLEDSVVYRLAMDKFSEVTRRFPEVSPAIIKALSIRLRWTAHMEAALKTQTTFERVCGVLFALAETFGVRSTDGSLIDLRLTQSDLAAVVGTSRQSMNVALHDLEKKAVISLQHRQITVTDKNELKILAYGL